MSYSIEDWEKRPSRVRNENRKLITKLSKQKSKKLDSIANAFHDSVFSEIDCLDCANCCKSIPPIVNETDIRRISKYLGIKTATFMTENVIVDEDGDMVLNQSPCKFLEEDNKCSIYDVRPKACRQYPHTNNFEFSQNMRLHLPNSEYCPAVYHILEKFKEI